MNMVGQIGGIVTASMTPWIAHHFQLDGLISGGCVVLCAIGSVVWLVVDPETKLESC